MTAAWIPEVACSKGGEGAGRAVKLSFNMDSAIWLAEGFRALVGEG